MANRRDWMLRGYDTPTEEKFLKRRYKKRPKNRKKSLRDHRRMISGRIQPLT